MLYYHTFSLFFSDIIAMVIQQRSVYTKAEERGARLNYILCDTATRTCHDVFHQQLGYPENPTDLFNHLQSPQIFAILHKLKKPRGRVITQEQWDLLFPPIPLSPATDSHTFDITLWCILLRSICNLPAPSNGWDRDPNVNDNTLSANLVRLRLCRNRLRAHVCSISLSELEFNRYWQEVEDVLIVLGCSKAEIDSRKTESLDPDLVVKHNDLLKELVKTEDLLDKQIDAIKEDIDRLKSKHKETEQNEKIRGKSNGLFYTIS